MLGMYDACKFELNGGFQYYNPTPRSLSAVSTAAGMSKPTHPTKTALRLNTANDQWALNCGVINGVANQGLRVKMLDKNRFSFGLNNPRNKKLMLASDLGSDADKTLVLHTSNTHEKDIIQKYKKLNIWLLETD